MALTQPGKNKGHIPYRNSKITELLADSFGGSAFCVLVTCINPTHAEESTQTLQYATRALGMKQTILFSFFDLKIVIFSKKIAIF